MRAGYGGTIQGCTLTEGQAHISSGTFENVTVVECYEEGDIEVTWHSGQKQTITMTSGWVNPIDCKSVRIVSGTWNLAKV